MKIISSLTIFPVTDLERTAEYYVNKLGFRSVAYVDVTEPHICLYRDAVEIILIKTNKEVIPNRIQYGYGADAYFITDAQETLQEEFRRNGGKFVKEVSVTDYNNKELIVEDIDGRWLIFGKKQQSETV